MQLLVAMYIRPAFVNTLFPVTHPHHIYSTALVIIIEIDNLKYVIYIGFLPWKIPEVSKMYLGVQVSKSSYCSDVYYRWIKSLD